MRLIAAVLLTAYLYTLAFGIFMTEFFRIPAPFIFCFPLLIFFRQPDVTGFLYWRTLALLLLAGFLYSVVGMSANNSFFANMISITLCAFFFSHYVGNSTERFNGAVLVFFMLLSLSVGVLLLDHFYANMGSLRSTLMGEPIIQSPSGIAVYQFNFGYQVAALGPFAFIYTCVFHKPMLIRGIVLAICIGFLFLCMQRSAFIAFVTCVVLFMSFYYREKAVVSIGLVVLVFAGLYMFVLKDNLENIENIVTKNEHNDAAYDRSGLVGENLRIYLDYPYGLIFYGKTWNDVIYRDYVFSSGITSHNAYLMFFTYLGPFLGLGFLIAVYYKICSICLHVIRKIREQENALLVCLCFSFIGVSINALSHNPWLIGADGPTIFLYFGIMHLYWQQQVKAPVAEAAVKNIGYA